MPIEVIPVDKSGNVITGSGGGAATIADGADIALGALADAAKGDESGSLNAHLRQLIRSSTPFTVPVTLTVSNDVYTIGDAVGGLITIPGVVSAAGKMGMLTNILLAGVAAVPYNLFFFPADITTPAANNAVGTMIAADIAGCKGIVPILASHYTAPVSAFNIATLVPANANLPLFYSCVATTLYAYMIATAVTSPGTTTLTATFKGFWLN